jgi:hypothetical protein
MIDQNLKCINCDGQGIDKNFIEVPYKYFIEETELMFRKKTLGNKSINYLK